MCDLSDVSRREVRVVWPSRRVSVNERGWLYGALATTISLQVVVCGLYM